MAKKTQTTFGVLTLGAPFKDEFIGAAEMGIDSEDIGAVV